LRLDRHEYPGRLVTFCGVDGSGKTTLLRLVGEHLRLRGAVTHETRMPTDMTRKHPLMLRFMYDPDAARRTSVDFLAVSLLAMADRLQQVKDEIAPCLEQGAVVLCDRYVYQAVVFARAMAEREAELVAIAERFPAPDLAVFPYVPVETALARINEREKDKGRFMDNELLARQVAEYRNVAASSGGCLLQSDGPAAATFEKLCPQLDALVAGMPGAGPAGAHPDPPTNAKDGH